MNRTVLVGLLVAVGFVVLACAGGCSTAPPAPMIGQGDSAEHSECGVLLVFDVDAAGNMTPRYRAEDAEFGVLHSFVGVKPGEDPRNPDGHYRGGRYPNWH